MMKTYLDPVQIGQISMKNRIIRSATLEYAADKDGRFTNAHLKLYETLAQGKVGAIITGMVSVSSGSQYALTMVKAYSKYFTNDLFRITRLLRSYDCPLIVQLCHCGLTTIMPEIQGRLVGPSAIMQNGTTIGRAMSIDEIHAVAQDFAEAAEKCREAGASGVQIHSAHGFLLSQFLSPYYNHRCDTYGGSLENRSRFLLEVYDAIRNRVGRDFPVWIKINSEDCIHPGLTLDESIAICREMETRGIDAIEYSVGLNADQASFCSRAVKKDDSDGYIAAAALRLMHEVSVPVISVGGYRSPEGIDEQLARGLEYISLSRPLVAEPNLINRWSCGDRKRARCISCNKCFSPESGHLSCQIFKN